VHLITPRQLKCFFFCRTPCPKALNSLLPLPMLLKLSIALDAFSIQTRTTNIPQVSTRRVFAPGEHIHLDNASYPVPKSLVDEGHWPSTNTNMESLIGTDAFSNFLMEVPYDGSATAAQSVEIYFESTMFEDCQEVIVGLQSCLMLSPSKMFVNSAELRSVLSRRMRTGITRVKVG
jgi:hypothetical protein